MEEHRLAKPVPCNTFEAFFIFIFYLVLRERLAPLASPGYSSHGKPNGITKSMNTYKLRHTSPEGH